MDLKNDKNWQKELDEFLDNILKTSNEEAQHYYEHLQEIREIRDAIYNKTKLTENTRIAWRECYVDAIEMWTSKTTVFEIDKKLSSETLLFTTTLRESLFLGIQEMEKYPKIVPEKDFQKSLIAFLDFIEIGNINEEQRLSTIRYLAHVAHAISKKLKPFKV